MLRSFAPSASPFVRFAAAAALGLSSASAFAGAVFAGDATVSVTADPGITLTGAFDAPFSSEFFDGDAFAAASVDGFVDPDFSFASSVAGGDAGPGGFATAEASTFQEIAVEVSSSDFDTKALTIDIAGSLFVAADVPGPDFASGGLVIEVVSYGGFFDDFLIEVFTDSLSEPGGLDEIFLDGFTVEYASGAFDTIAIFTSIDGIAEGAPAAVPAPATALLVLVGLLGGLARRRA
jgi:hypothetical protein